MAFSKFIAAGSELLSGIFASDHGGLFAVNGRLSGFHPIPPSGGDPGTPGICTTTLLDGTIQRYISLSLSAPADSDDQRFPVGGQTKSFSIIDGTIVQSDATVGLNLVLHEPPIATLLDQIPLIIYMSLPNTVEDPVFDIARESVIDAGPQKIAKLAFYDPETQTWMPYPAVSLRGIYQRLITISNRLGGFFVTVNSPTQLQVSSGFIVSQFGRIINPSIAIVAPLLPSPATWRKDVLFVNDPGAEDVPITFTTLMGRDGVATQALARTEPPERPDSPRMVPLAEIILNSSGAVESIDVRPVQAWQTDALQARDPNATDMVNITTVQPGLSFTDAIPNADKVWEILLMRGKDPFTGIVNKSKFAVGLTGQEVERTFLAPASGSLTFVPGANQFSVSPYVIESAFSITSITAGRDVTDDPVYGVNFDFLNGRFVPFGITAQSYGEQFQVKFRQLQVLFAFDDGGDVSIPELDLIRRHIAANSPYWELPPGDPLNLPYTSLPDNPAAHTGFNIVVDNSVKFLPGGGSIPSAVSAQRAIEILAAFDRPPPPDPLAGKRFALIWRTGSFLNLIWTKLGDLVNNFRFIGPTGSTYIYSDVDDPDFDPTPISSAVDGLRFQFASARVVGISLSVMAHDSSAGVTNTVSDDAIFSVWIDNVKIAIPENRMTRFRGPGGTGAKIRMFGEFALPSPVPITLGQVVRLSMGGPSFAVSGTPLNNSDITIDSLSMDIFVELT